MLYILPSCRRRWARRGRAVADFLFGFTLAGLGHLLIGVLRVVTWLVGGLASLRRRRQARLSGHREEIGTLGTGKSPERQESADAVEALVSLGIPRRVAEARVAATIAEHGMLPMEQLLPKALSPGQE
jgi:hypothetical protein